MLLFNIYQIIVSRLSRFTTKIYENVEFSREKWKKAEDKRDLCRGNQRSNPLRMLNQYCMFIEKVVVYVV